MSYKIELEPDFRYPIVFGDIPINGIFSFFSEYDTAKFCKLSDDSYMVLDNKTQCNGWVFQNIDKNSPVIPFNSLNDIDSTEPSIKRFDELKEGDLFLKPRPIANPPLTLYMFCGIDKITRYKTINLSFFHDENLRNIGYLETLYQKNDNLYVLTINGVLKIGTKNEDKTEK